MLARERFENWTPMANGWLFAYIGFWLVVAQGWFVRRYMQRIGERRFIILGTLCLALGMLAIGYARSPWLIGAVAPVAVFGLAMITPSVASLLSQKAATGTQGEVQGVNQSVQSLARIVGPVSGGVLLGMGLELPYQVGAAAMLVAFVVGLRLR